MPDPKVWKPDEDEANADWPKRTDDRTVGDEHGRIIGMVDGEDKMKKPEPLVVEK